MTQDEIIRMAREAGLICESRPVTAWIESTDLTPYLTRFAALVAAHEREKQAEQVAEWEKLKDPVTLHLNLLRGFPARLTPEMLLHLLGNNAPQPVQQELLAGLSAALEALVYHTAQTRPIHKTNEAISQIQNLLSQEASK